MTGNQSKPWHPDRKHYRCSRRENLTVVIEPTTLTGLDSCDVDVLSPPRASNRHSLTETSNIGLTVNSRTLEMKMTEKCKQ